MSRPQPQELQSGGHDAKLVRNACNACHTRKIRCVTPENGGPCLHCQSKDLSCYFLPRYKSGRPRANTPSAEWARDSAHNGNGTIEVAVEPELAKGCRRGRPSSDGPEPPWPAKRHQKMKPSHQQHPFGTHYGHNFWVMFTNDLPDLFADDLFDSSTGPPVSPQPRLIDDAFVPRTRTSSPNDTINISNQSTLRRCPPHETGYLGGACEAQFFALLHHCGKLQHLIRTMTPADLPTPAAESTLGTPEVEGEAPDHLYEVLDSVDSSCEVMLEMCDKRAISGLGAREDAQPMDLANVSLIVAVACKVLQVFNIVLNHKSLRVTSIKGMLIHKKLDLYLTQVRAVMEQIERETQNGPFLNKELFESYSCLSKRLASLYQETHQCADVIGMDLGTV
ncbi:RING-3 [Apiospora kogelbergensis]|uniref:RING-3 n=1 Tax=Apiospora kogelbergensis TaxID=1337665 RepID=UPI00312EBD2F